MNTILQTKLKVAPNKSFTPTHTGHLQRKCASDNCAERRKKRLTLQRSSTNHASTVPPIVHEVLRSPGKPIDQQARAFMEPRFGHDFSKVRIHADAKAAASARAVNALAYTVGQNIVFSAGQYAPYMSGGRGLLAHELAHVVQQRSNPIHLLSSISHENQDAEKEAGFAAWNVLSSKAIQPIKIGLTPQPTTLAKGEKWDAIWGVGPWDAYKAKKLADKALSEAKKTGLPGLHNGPGDAWRHCYWNCTMTAEIGSDQAKIIADNHEKHGGGPANENAMDYHNNAEGRSCGGKNCDICCQDRLDKGKLRVLDSKGAVVPSTPTKRTKAPATGSGEYKY